MTVVLFLHTFFVVFSNRTSCSEKNIRAGGSGSSGGCLCDVGDVKCDINSKAEPHQFKLTDQRTLFSAATAEPTGLKEQEVECVIIAKQTDGVRLEAEVVVAMASIPYYGDNWPQ